MIFINDFFYWHYAVKLRRLLIVWRNLTVFPLYYFSVYLHLTTLFSPWKRQVVRKTKLGLHLGDLLGRLIINLVSRILGALLRLVIIGYGLIFTVIFFIFGGLFVSIWTCLPLFTFFIYLFIGRDQSAQQIIQRSKNRWQNILIELITSNQGYFTLSHSGIHPGFVLAKIRKDTDAGEYTTFPGNIETMTLADLWETVAVNYSPFRVLLERAKIKSQEVKSASLWYEKLEHDKPSPIILDLKRIKGLPGIGVNWAYGYTPEFDRYSFDLTQMPSNFPFVVGREKELRDMEKILLETESNNILVIGEPGVTRHALVKTLAYRIKNGDCPARLSHKRILQLDMPKLLAEFNDPVKTKGKLEELLSEAQDAGNIILVIDNLDKYVSWGEGRVDLSEIFIQYAHSLVGIIGISTPEFFHRFIERNDSLVPLFEKIEIESASPEVVVDELEISICPVLERKYRIIISIQAIVKTVEDAQRYISSTPFPAKAVDLLDDACIYLTAEIKDWVLLPQHIEATLSQKMKLPLGELKAMEKEKLAHLEDLLHSRVINQEQAIRTISSALRRARLDVSSPNKPIGSFLFLGPTGVGKTETARSLAYFYFGSEENMIRFDMSQYHGQEGIDRLLGSEMSGNSGELVSKLKDTPFSLILLDEFEKTDKEIYNLFLTLFDEGYISDAWGKRIDGKNTIIIATSNAGAEHIRESLKRVQNPETLKEEWLEYIQSKELFTPELLNRFDKIVVFTPLSEGHLREVAKLQLNALNKRLKPKEISIKPTPDLIRYLAAAGYDPNFGARAMKRLIVEKVEDEVAKRLLQGNVQKGEEIEINV